MSLVARENPVDLEALIATVRGYNPGADPSVLRRAYALADQAHQGQTRDDGAPYIEHPLRVAEILADLQMDLPTIVAGLLHDVVEDTSVDLATIEQQFGAEVARLVDGVTKLSQTELSQRTLEESGGAEEELDETQLTRRREAELRRRAANIRKIFLAMARDIRVMIIKLADRLHNMQTLDELPPARQRRIAQETLEIFAPLAHRLGIWYFKWQLEDLAFKYLYPEEYDRIVAAVNRTRREREAEVIQTLKERLQREGIQAVIQGRPKHLYSIWEKIRRQEISFEQIFDLTAVRIIVDTVSECYHCLGVVHELWLPIPGLFSDHIARPKSNMYQSLHTKVIGPRGEPLEIQIRTWEMHRTADFGIAAHWQYKEGAPLDRRFEEKLSWLRQQLFDWQSDSTTDTEFMRSVVEDLFVDQVFVFTPKGDVIDLPAGSGPIDFAFRIHSDVGMHCVGAKVNGRLVPLTYQFKNGDVVEILTKPTARPSYDWLALVKTSHARSRIRAWLRKQRYAESVAAGREALEREAQRLGADPKEVLVPEALARVAEQLNYQSEEDLFAAIGDGRVAPGTVLHRLRAQQPQRREVITGRPVAEAKLSITAGGVDGVFIKRSQCCSPVPGDEVVGYVTRGRGMAIHRRTCPNAQRALQDEPDRVVEVAWTHAGSEKHPVKVRVETVDRPGLLNEIAAVFSERKINVEQANIRTQSQTKTAVWDLVIDVADNRELEMLVRRLQNHPDVLAIQRVESTRRRR